MKSNPLVSIVIPTYNSERTIGVCLRSVREQTYPNIEVIVVDNYSTDGTKEMAERYGARVVLLRAGRSEAKNVGASLARGEFILFTDSDMELTLRVVEECLEVVKNNDERVGGVIIPERSVGRSFWIKVRDFERSFYAGTEIESARFFKKDLAKKVGGFDEDIICFEESTLPQKIEKLGYNVRVRINAKILHHEEDFSLLKWLKKKYQYGKTACEYRLRYKEYGIKQISLLYRFGLFFRNKRFYSKPLLALGVIVLKTLEYAASGLGYLAGR